MTNFEFLLAIFAVAGGVLTIFRAIYKIAEMKSSLEKQIDRKNEDLNRSLRQATSKIELQLKGLEGEQKQEIYRFRVLEGQIQDLRNHQRDLEKYLQSKENYQPRPYSQLENTEGRRIDRES